LAGFKIGRGERARPPCSHFPKGRDPSFSSLSRSSVLPAVDCTHHSRLAGGSKFGSPEDPIYYRVYDWQLAQKDDDGEGIAAANSKGLSTLVLRKKRILSEAFRQVDKDQSGFISRAKWSSIMEKVTGMSISWPALMSVLVDDEDIRADDGAIQWQNFLNKVRCQQASCTFYACPSHPPPSPAVVSCPAANQSC
jgi:hypothetical protein